MDLQISLKSFAVFTFESHSANNSYFNKAHSMYYSAYFQVPIKRSKSVIGFGP